MDAILTYRKRVITPDDLSLARKVIDEHQSPGRSAISRRLCEVWNWRQANGQLKDCVCRSLLLQLERSQHITLPPSRAVNNNSQRRKKPFSVVMTKNTRQVATSIFFPSLFCIFTYWVFFKIGIPVAGYPSLVILFLPMIYLSVDSIKCN